ncbi:tetratricopeptide repeat protein 19, mitochondrial-like isoform X2 [Ornithodoros turicata]|uniref:tetratricopeptide repeat protein 19, mitochondrial-like isoform X2 n=1 Tax=Ornithodoros turicata TaxID=34597 RepID=UPI003139255E
MLGNNNYWQNRYTTGVHPHSFRVFTLGGILAFLGLEKPKEDPLIHTIKLGILSWQRKEYNKAESILHVALKMAQEQMNEKGVTYIYDILANVAFDKGDHSKAEKLFIEVMQRAISTGMPQDDNAVVEMSLKLAQLYSLRNDTSKAEEGFQFCIDTQKKKMSAINMADASALSDYEQDTLLLWAMSMDAYGKHHMKHDRLKEARICFEEALTVCEQVNGKLHDQTLVLLNDVATVCSHLGDFSSAHKFITEAIQRGKDSDSPDLPVFYCNLGAVLLREGQDLEMAGKVCQEALKLAKKMKHAKALEDAQGCLDELKQRKRNEVRQ